MSALLDRRERLLRLREIEHRVAAVSATEAHGTLANLHDVAGRIAALRDHLAIGAGPSSGQALKAMCEMKQRLDIARKGLTQPINDAEADVARKRALRVHADQKERSATQLRDRAATAAVKARELRADANRPFRKRPVFGDMM